MTERRDELDTVLLHCRTRKAIGERHLELGGEENRRKAWEALNEAREQLRGVIEKNLERKENGERLLHAAAVAECVQALLELAQPLWKSDPAGNSPFDAVIAHARDLLLVIRHTIEVEDRDASEFFARAKDALSNSGILRPNPPEVVEVHLEGMRLAELSARNRRDLDGRQGEPGEGCEEVLSGTYDKVKVSGLALAVCKAFMVISSGRQEFWGKAGTESLVEEAVQFLQSLPHLSDPAMGDDVRGQVVAEVESLQKRTELDKGASLHAKLHFITQLLLDLALRGEPERLLNAIEIALADPRLAAIGFARLDTELARWAPAVEAIDILEYVIVHAPWSARPAIVSCLCRRLNETRGEGVCLFRAAVTKVLFEVTQLAHDLQDASTEEILCALARTAKDEGLSSSEAGLHAAAIIRPLLERLSAEGDTWRGLPWVRQMQLCVDALADAGLAEGADADAVAKRSDSAAEGLYRVMARSDDVSRRLDGIEQLVRLEARKPARVANYEQVEAWAWELHGLGAPDLEELARAVASFTGGDPIDHRTGKKWEKRSVTYSLGRINGYLAVHEDDEQALRLRAAMHWEYHERVYGGNPDCRATNLDASRVFAHLADFLVTQHWSESDGQKAQSLLADALDYADKAVRSSPRGAEPLCRHAEILRLLGRTDEAVQEAKKVLDAARSKEMFGLIVKDPDQARAEGVIAKVCLSQGRFDDVLAVLKGRLLGRFRLGRGLRKSLDANTAGILAWAYGVRSRSAQANKGDSTHCARYVEYMRRARAERGDPVQADVLRALASRS